MPSARPSPNHRSDAELCHGRIAIEGLSRESNLGAGPSIAGPTLDRGKAAIRTRLSVADGVSPKDRQYSAENRPRWRNPYRSAAAVTEVPEVASSRLSRAATKRRRRKYCNGERPRKARKCLPKVRSAEPETRTRSAIVTLIARCSRMYSMARLTSRGTGGSNAGISGASRLDNVAPSCKAAGTAAAA
jgi:hypothetical protein